MMVIGRRRQIFPGVHVPVPMGPRGERVEMALGDIVALGRARFHGDFVIRVLARLTSGEVVQVVVSEQAPEVKRALERRLRRWTRTPQTSRAVDYAEAWEGEGA
jgi:hypothetical protein